MAISLQAIKITETLAVNLQALLDAPVIALDSIDSTNNYAIRLIDADTAQAGLTVITASQTGGKGQRGKTWADEPGQSLLMSLVTTPLYAPDRQTVFNACVATAIADAIQDLYENWQVHIKWPNDIIVNDKKAGGVLIENILRGSKWSYAIIGFGLNVLQEALPADLPYATSLRIASGKVFAVKDVLNRIRSRILEETYSVQDTEAVMEKYNSYLYKRGEVQEFFNNELIVKATIQRALPTGQLEVALEDGSIQNLTHGSLNWRWQ